jgi:hypothetical protein
LSACSLTFFPDSLHIRPLAGSGMGNRAVWQVAADYGCQLLRARFDVIKIFETHAQATFLALG